jgi:hypothetical protein
MCGRVTQPYWTDADMQRAQTPSLNAQSPPSNEDTFGNDDKNDYNSGESPGTSQKKARF